MKRFSELQEQFRLMELKKKVLKYGLAVQNLADLTMAKGLMNYILAQTDVLDALEDALLVVHAYHGLNENDSLVIRLRRLLGHGKLSQAENLLRTGSELMTNSPSKWNQEDLYFACLEISNWQLESLKAVSNSQSPASLLPIFPMRLNFFILKN